jgi:hypothetical protein
MALQRKVAGIDQVDIDVLKVPRIGQRARRREERVVPTPDHQRRGLVLAEIRPPERILCEVVAVVVEQVELDLRIARTVEEILVERPRVRTDQLRVAGAADIAEPGDDSEPSLPPRLQSSQGVECHETIREPRRKSPDDHPAQINRISSVYVYESFQAL